MSTPIYMYVYVRKAHTIRVARWGCVHSESDGRPVASFLSFAHRPTDDPIAELPFTRTHTHIPRQCGKDGSPLPALILLRDDNQAITTPPPPPPPLSLDAMEGQEEEKGGEGYDASVLRPYSAGCVGSCHAMPCMT